MDPPGEARVEGFASSEPAAAAIPALESFPIESNGPVERFLELFRTEPRREIVGRWLDRSTRYLDMIRQVFRQKGLPEDLAFTAMVESGFNPVAVSRAGAKGLWQFMEQTARRYGLRVDQWVDERLDPVKSTEAAADYLKDLFTQFGHWFLALAAYNAGELKVARAVERSRSNDFWTIARGRWLLEETKQFVPQVQAATLIGREPERYGFQVTPQELVPHEIVRVPASVELKKLAVLAGLDPETLRDLNTELRRGMTPPGGPYSLKVPQGGGPATEEALEKLQRQKTRIAKRQSGRVATALAPAAGVGVHVVKPGDTLSAIAKRYGVPVNGLKRFNDLPEEARLYPGDRIQLRALTVARERELAR